MEANGSNQTNEPVAPPPADLLPVQRKATPAYRLIRVLLIPLFHVLFIFQVKGHRNTPKGRAYVMIANHLNWLDSFALTALFPPEPRIHFLGDPPILQTLKVQRSFARMVGGYIQAKYRD